MESFESSGRHFSDSASAGQSPKIKPKKLFTKYRGNCSKDSKSASHQKEKESTSSVKSKKPSYSISLHKFRRKVRKTYSVADLTLKPGKGIRKNWFDDPNLSSHSSISSTINRVSRLSLDNEDVPQNTDSISDVSTLFFKRKFSQCGESSSDFQVENVDNNYGKVLKNSLDFDSISLKSVQSERASSSKFETENLKDEQNFYVYEAAGASSNDCVSVSSQSDTASINFEQSVPAPPAQEDEQKEKSYIYIDVNELFERPSFVPSGTSIIQQSSCPCLVEHGRDKSNTNELNQGKSSVSPEQENSNTIGDNNSIKSALFRYSDPYFPSLMQDSIRELAMDGQFADVTVEVDGHRIRCHRMILAAGSKYFKAMFCNAYRERDQPSVKIQGVTADMMKTLIRYAYTSCLEIRSENVQNVLEAASLLQFDRVMEACSNYFVGELSIENAPGIMELAYRHNLKDLLVLARLKCVTCFDELREKSDFLVLSRVLLESLICRNDLKVYKEEDVFLVVMEWCENQVEERKQCLPQLLQHVKLPLLEPIFFVQCVENHPLIRNNPDVFDLMMEARRYQAIGDATEGFRIIPRHNTFVNQVFVTVGGCNKDDNFINDVSMLDFQHKTRAVLCQLPNVNNASKNVHGSATIEPERKTKWAEFACTVWKGNIIISGGKETKKEVWMFITTLRQWVGLALLNTARWRHRMTVCFGELYAVGGFDGLLRVDSLEKYNERQNRWREMSSMKEAVSSAAVCECNGRIYVMGGGPSIRVATEKVQVYNPATDAWALSTPMPSPAKCINAASLREMIYIVGGTLRQILRFDSFTETWSFIGEKLLSERASCGITICNDLVFIVGGRDDTGRVISNVSYLDTDSHTIRSECNMAFGISHHGCVTLQKFDHLKLKTF